MAGRKLAVLALVGLAVVVLLLAAILRPKEESVTPLNRHSVLEDVRTIAAEDPETGTRTQEPTVADFLIRYPAESVIVDQPEATLPETQYKPPENRREFAKQFPPVDPRVELIVAPPAGTGETVRLEALRALREESADEHYKADLDLLAHVLSDPAETDLLRHETANLLADEGYERLTDVLLYVLDNPVERERFRAFCVQHLWQRMEKAERDDARRIADRLIVALEDDDTAVRRESLLALMRGGHPAAMRTAEEWLNDPGARGLRDMAIRCMRDMQRRDQIDVIRSFLESGDEAERIAAIVTLAEWGDAKSIPAFEAAAQSENPRLQGAGQTALAAVRERRR